MLNVVRAVPLVGEAVAGLRGRQPHQVVHFGGRREVTAQGTSGPVADLLGAVGNWISDGSQAPCESAVVTGFLAHFANGGNRLRLARVEFSLGQRPVVVAGAMDQRNLDRRRGGCRGAVFRGLPQHRTRGENRWPGSVAHGCR